MPAENDCKLILNWVSNGKLETYFFISDSDASQFLNPNPAFSGTSDFDSAWFTMHFQEQAYPLLTEMQNIDGNPNLFGLQMLFNRSGFEKLENKPNPMVEVT